MENKILNFKIIILIFLTLYSCPKKKEIESQIYDCLSAKIDEGNGGSSKEYFHCLKEMETLSVRKMYILSLTNQGYSNFFENLYYNEDKLKQVFEELNNNTPNYLNFSSTLILFWYKSCLYNSLENNPDSELIKIKLQYFELLEESGFSDFQSYMELIRTTDFENEKDRLMCLSLLYIFMYNKST